MTPDEIIALAKQVGVEATGNEYWPFFFEELVELVKRVEEKATAIEREACAKVCEEYETNNDITATWLNIVAEAIRARGQA